MQNKKQFECTLCSKILSTKDSLKKHSMLHTGEKPYECVLCSKHFISKNSMITHMEIHTREPPVCCSVCNNLIDVNIIASHIEDHKLKRFSCNDCGKLFRLKSELKKHQIMHEDKIPHKCDVCGKQIDIKRNLIKHMMAHSDGVEKPYKCLYLNCEKSFSRKDHLTTHTRVHNGEKPYKCKYCENKFTTCGQLKIHTISNHSSIDEINKIVTLKY